jgi:hypothetical protein
MKREHQPKPPFSVDVVDQFDGAGEDGYGQVGSFDTLEAAVAEARRITEEAIKSAGSYKNWEGMGDAGLVYDAAGRLVWSGVKVAAAEHSKR